MKSSDIAMLILIASVSVGLAYGAVSAIPALEPPDKAVKVPTIEEYTADITEPNPKVFNEDAINPTVDVTIGNSTPASPAEQ